MARGLSSLQLSVITQKNWPRKEKSNPLFMHQSPSHFHVFLSALQGEGNDPDNLPAGRRLCPKGKSGVSFYSQIYLAKTR